MSTFDSSLSITHIGTATIIIKIDDVNILTNPVFIVAVAVLDSNQTPAIQLTETPPIDAVLLSHEDDSDNLDELGHQLLEVRKIITTINGTKNLAPRPCVRGIKPWEAVKLNVGGKIFNVTGTPPCEHLPGGERTGFILESPDFGTTDGELNIIFISRDTKYLEKLVSIRKKYRVSVAIIHFDGTLYVLHAAHSFLRLFWDHT